MAASSSSAASVFYTETMYRSHSPLPPSSTLRPPITPFPPVKNSSVCSVCSVGQPSAVRPQSSAVRHLPSVIPPILAPFARLCGQSTGSRPSSVVRRPSSAVSRPIRFLRLLRVFAANPRSSPHPARSAPEHSRGRNDSASSKTITPALAPSFAIHQSSCEGLRS